MSIEKILIFGFAIAIVSTLTLLSTDVVDQRQTSESNWRTKIEDLRDKAK